MSVDLGGRQPFGPRAHVEPHQLVAAVMLAVLLVVLVVWAGFS